MGVRSYFRTAFGLDEPVLRDAGFDQWLSQFGYGGLRYPISPATTMQGTQQRIDSTFSSYVTQGFQSNGIVYACEQVRVLLFSEARFQFRRFKDGRPGDLFGTAALIPLHNPWPGGTTGDLLSIMELDAAFAGNAFVYRNGLELKRLRPDWVTIVFSGPAWDLSTKVLGYLYQEGGPAENKEPIALDASTVAHYMPMPDPLSPQRGMGWLTPVLREVGADSQATDHKQLFFENGATVNLVLEYDREMTTELFKAAVAAFAEGHEGSDNAYKALHLLGGTAKAIGSTFNDMDFKSVQGAGETRIAAASGVGPIIAQLSEGLQGSSLNAGNYASARRRVADGLFRPLWRNAAGSLAKIIEVPAGAELWYDERDIAWLREDAKDEAETQQVQANAAKSLIDAGFEPESVVAAITSDDLTKLKHTHLFSVQLQPPMPEGPPEPPTPELAATNGNGTPQILDPTGKV